MREHEFEFTDKFVLEQKIVDGIKNILGSSYNPFFHWSLEFVPHIRDTIPRIIDGTLSSERMDVVRLRRQHKKEFGCPYGSSTNIVRLNKGDPYERVILEWNGSKIESYQFRGNPVRHALSKREGGDGLKE